MVAWRGAVLFGLLAFYALGLAVLPPPIALVSDEAQYIRQALAYADGHTRVPVRDPLSGKVGEELPSTYPPGRHFCRRRSCRVGGWSAACWASFIGLCGADASSPPLATEEGNFRSRYAALVAALRTSQRARTNGDGRPSECSGRRDLSLLPRAVDEDARRDRRWLSRRCLARSSGIAILCSSPPGCSVAWSGGRAGTAMVCAAIVGVALRFALAWVLPGRMRPARTVYPFTLDGAGERALLYGFALTVFVPGGIGRSGRVRQESAGWS